MASEDFPAPTEGFVLTHFIVAADVARSRDFSTSATAAWWRWGTLRWSSSSIPIWPPSGEGRAVERLRVAGGSGLAMAIV
jgi:hypothetical protein